MKRHGHSWIVETSLPKTVNDLQPTVPSPEMDPPRAPQQNTSFSATDSVERIQVDDSSQPSCRDNNLHQLRLSPTAINPPRILPRTNPNGVIGGPVLSNLRNSGSQDGSERSRIGPLSALSGGSRLSSMAGIRSHPSSYLESPRLPRTSRQPGTTGPAVTNSANLPPASPTPRPGRARMPTPTSAMPVTAQNAFNEALGQEREKYQQNWAARGRSPSHDDYYPRAPPRDHPRYFGPDGEERMGPEMPFVGSARGQEILRGLADGRAYDPVTDQMYDPRERQMQGVTYLNFGDTNFNFSSAEIHGHQIHGSQIQSNQVQGNRDVTDVGGTLGWTPLSTSTRENNQRECFDAQYNNNDGLSNSLEPTLDASSPPFHPQNRASAYQTSPQYRHLGNVPDFAGHVPFSPAPPYSTSQFYPHQTQSINTTPNPTKLTSLDPTARGFTPAPFAATREGVAKRPRPFRPSRLCLECLGKASRPESRLATGTNYLGDIYSNHFHLQRPNLSPALNCAVFGTNLPYGDYTAFFDIVREGTVQHLHIKPPTGSHLTYAFSLSFNTPASAHQFLSRGDNGDLVVGGHRLKVVPDKFGFERCNTDETRVLIIDGPAKFVNWPYLKSQFDRGSCYDVDRFYYLQSLVPGQVRMEVRFARVTGQSQSCKQVLERNPQHEGVLFVQYGPDPCDPRNHQPNPNPI